MSVAVIVDESKQFQQKDQGCGTVNGRLEDLIFGDLKVKFAEKLIVVCHFVHT